MLTMRSNYLYITCSTYMTRKTYVFYGLIALHMYTKYCTDSSLVPVTCIYTLGTPAYDQCTKKHKIATCCKCFEMPSTSLVICTPQEKNNVAPAPAKLRSKCTQSLVQKAVLYRLYASSTPAYDRCTKSNISAKC